MTKTTKKKNKTLAAKAAAQLQKELAPIFKVCNVLSKKYATLAAAETKKEKAAEKLLAKAPESQELRDLVYAHGDLARTYTDIADYLKYAPAGKDRKYPCVPSLGEAAEMDEGDFYDIDRVAKAVETAKSATKPSTKKAKPLTAANGKVTGGAPLSGVAKKGGK